MKIIGSTSLFHYKLNRKQPKDIDRVFFEGEVIEGEREDDTILPVDLYNLLETDSSGVFVIPEHILSLKMSHFAWDIHWEKTKNDILWLKSYGLTFNPVVYSKFKTYWEKVHGSKKFLSLRGKKEAFFNDFVKYDHDHDYLHELVAFPNQPVYSDCLVYGEEVLIDQNKFNNLSFEDQVKMFREEITVIASERWLLKGHASWFESYMLSLKKTITSLTKNWASDFIITNLEHFVTPKFSFFKNLIKTLKENDMTDTTTFHKIAENLGVTVDELVYTMCSDGDLAYLIKRKKLTGQNGKYCTENYEKLSAAAIKNAGIEGYEHIHQEGGGEGGAEYCYGVFKLGGKFYRAEYSYYSYSGDAYDGIAQTIREVIPTEKTITVYE